MILFKYGVLFSKYAYDKKLWTDSIQDCVTKIEVLSSGMVEESEVPNKKAPSFGKQTAKLFQTRIYWSRIRT